MQKKQPLTLALSPSDGERESPCAFSKSARSGEGAGAQVGFSLAPSDRGEGNFQLHRYGLAVRPIGRSTVTSGQGCDLDQQRPEVELAGNELLPKV